ncbi:MAG TPA: carboxypeptidase-like regulatory domain-containing protein, partial [Gemmatimonadales bacterium]
MRLALPALLAAAGSVRALHAQSLDAGALSGTVTDRGGHGLPEATITLTERITGVARIKQTPRGGTFGFTLLLPSSYDVLVERFGYRPRLVRNVPVRAGSSLHLDVSL